MWYVISLNFVHKCHSIFPTAKFTGTEFSLWISYGKLQTGARCEQLYSWPFHAPVKGILEHFEPGWHIKVSPHLLGHPGALPWEKASLGVGHDSKMSAIVRTKGSNPITGAIRVEGIDLSGLAVVVNIFHSHKIVSTHILINLLRTEHHSTYFKNTKY